jgi:Protein of unknown function (DUF5132)
MPHILIFLLGAAAAAVLKATGGTVARPVVKNVVKGGILFGRRVQEFASSITEDLQDVTAEASSEIDDKPRRAAAAATTPPKGV